MEVPFPQRKWPSPLKDENSRPVYMCKFTLFAVKFVLNRQSIRVTVHDSLLPVDSQVEAQQD